MWLGRIPRMPEDRSDFRIKYFLQLKTEGIVGSLATSPSRASGVAEAVLGEVGPAIDRTGTPGHVMSK